MNADSPSTSGSDRSKRPAREDVAALRARLRDLQAARADLPPHSAQGWRADLDAQIDAVRRRITRAERHNDRP